MNQRERFLAVMNYEPADRVPHFEFGAWNELFEIWHQQGLPTEISDNALFDEFFMIERLRTVPVDWGFRPHFEEEILEDKGEKVVIRDGKGVILEKMKHSATIPKFLEYPVKTRQDFDKLIAERLDPTLPDRYPEDFEDRITMYKYRDYPLGVHCGGLYGYIRDLMGVEGASMVFVTDPEFVEHMLDFRVDFTLKLIDRAASSLPLDFGSWWEDMAYRGGPLISPEMFHRFLVPRYKKITNRLRDYGITYHYLDCDGDITMLIKGWEEAGINVMFPVEVHAGSDPVKIRKEFGQGVRMMGGVDKMKLIEGKASIDAEIAKLKPLVAEGGFIPHVDHRVPPDVTFENYIYYLQEKMKMIFTTPVRP
jgi:hypothetical protein